MKSLPKWAENLLRAICPKELFEQIEGDLIEIFNYDVKTVGEQKSEVELYHYGCPLFQTRHHLQK